MSAAPQDRAAQGTRFAQKRNQMDLRANSARKRGPALAADLPKTPTGICGLDEITRGGLPRGRPLVMLTAMEGGGERKRELRIVKARGLPHSDEIRQFKLGRKGVQIVEASANVAEIPTGRRHIANSGHVRRLADQPAVGRQNATARQ